jgi:hypothetical protein
MLKKNIYIVLYGPIKQGKKCDFYLRRGDFIMLLKISQLNGQLQKKKKIIKIYTHN